MMLRLSILLATVLLSTITQAVPTSSGQKHLQLKVIRHQPCTSKAPADERIRISSIEQAPLVKDEKKGDGCYSISGPVQIKKPVSGTVQIYVQTRSGSRGPLEKCSGADAKGCGGVGSCVYCDICSAVKQAEKTAGSHVSVEQGGKPLDCAAGLQTGNYTDIKVSFCLPTKSEFLTAEGIDEDIWNEGGNSGGGHTFFLTMFLFNKPVNDMPNAKLLDIATDESDQIIGCHRLVGSVYEAK